MCVEAEGKRERERLSLSCYHSLSPRSHQGRKWAGLVGQEVDLARTREREAAGVRSGGTPRD